MKFSKWKDWINLRVKNDYFIHPYHIMIMLFDMDLNMHEYSELLRIMRENEEVRRNIFSFIPDRFEMEDKIV